ncbi:MAG: peptidoglycan-binding protein [Patescibacteria group bacterium]|nr:peptidoglycan-binding protein [Patescibacteria group bacterium]
MKHHFLRVPYIVSVCAVVMFAVVSSVYAATPTLSLTNLGDDSVQINVTGDPSSGVMLYYNIGSSSGSLSTTLGSTNAGGTFSTTLNSFAYAASAGTSAYVTVNGQQSSSQVWPSSSSGTNTSGAPSLSQSSLTVGLGQTAIVTSQGSSNAIYLSLNSAPIVATITISGTTITVTGNQLGTATATVCYVGSASNCANLSITIGSGTSENSAITFSQSNPIIAIGQAISVDISGGSGYYISATTNPSAASQAVNGSVLSITGLTNGTSTITVCSVSNGCGSVNATIGTTTTATASSATGNPTKLTFSIANPTISVGENVTTTLSGGTGNYSVSNNPSPNIIQASISGNILTLTGKGAGSAFVTVCSTGPCNTIFFTVINGPVPSSIVPTPTTVVADPTITPTPTVAPVVAPVVITTAQTVSNSEVLSAIQAMQSKLLQLVSEIQTMQNTLVQLVSKITSNTASGSVSSLVTAQASSGTYQFLNPLDINSEGSDVTALQNRLTKEGYYTGPVTGFYGSLTKAAVKEYQTAHGITPLGNVGPSTRASLNSQ